MRHRETITLNVALHEREGLRRELLDGLAQIVSYMPIRLDILENPPALCGDVNRLVRAHARSTGKVLGGMEHCPTCNPATPEDSRNRQWRQKRSLLMLPRTLHLGDRDAVLDLLLLPRQQRAHRALSPQYRLSSADVVERLIERAVRPRAGKKFVGSRDPVRPRG